MITYRRWLFIIPVLLILGFIAWYFSNIIAYILIAAVISFIGHPLANFLDRIHIGKFKMPRFLSALITLMVIVGLVAAFFYTFVPILVYQASYFAEIDVTELMASLKEPLMQFQNWALEKGFIEEGESIEEMIGAQLASLLNYTNLSDLFNQLIGLTGSIIIGIFAVLFISFFFIKDKYLFTNGILILMPDKYQDKTKKIIADTRYLLSRYFIGIVGEVISMITLLTIGGYIVGIKNAFFIGFIGGLMNIIPYLGPLIGATLGAFFVASANLDASFYEVTLPLMGSIVGVFAVCNLIDNIVLQPFIYSTSVKSHPVEIFLVILIAGSVAGVLGMILAIPTYTFFRVIAKQFLSNLKIVQKITERI
ncbi:MAG: AI-2E family transporter [Bacteroidales bacterium]|nr:AI-2E family transporter [Bacteroidales bacterium]